MIFILTTNFKLIIIIAWEPSNQSATARGTPLSAKSQAIRPSRRIKTIKTPKKSLPKNPNSLKKKLTKF